MADNTLAVGGTRDGHSCTAANTPTGSDSPHGRRAKRVGGNRHDSHGYNGDYRYPSYGPDASRARRSNCRVAAIGDHYVRRALA